MRLKPSIPDDVEEYRDATWWREPTRQVVTPLDAERFVEQVGFAACLTDSRRLGPSLYVAVCGRRDAVMPRNVQKDAEASLTWQLKDELLRRGNVYYAKLARGKATFIARRMIPHFHAIWGMRTAEESRRLSRAARTILNVLRHEWEMGTADLRHESGVKDRAAFNRALDELLRRRVSRDVAVREIARCFLARAGLTIPGELARVTGLSRPEAGRGNRALVTKGSRRC